MKRKPVSPNGDGLPFVVFSAYLTGDRYFAQKGLIFPLS